jgi:amino acid ABC transporter membrane protein, PAAT family (TC 3.A.1.3.-)
MSKLAQLGLDIAKLWNKYSGSYFSGMKNTLILALIGTLIGCLIGFACGVLNTIPYTKSDHPLKRFFLGLIRVVIRIYVEVFRGTPMVLQAVFFYYGLPYFSNNSLRFSSVWAAAIVVVSINTGAYMAESVRGGIISVDPGQTEGAKAIGMTHVQTMTCVILPQALRNIMPQIGNNFIINVKDTSVMFIIGFPDFFAAHRAAVGASYLYFPSATVEMAGYLTMTLVASFLLRWMEKKMDGSASYELVQVDSLTMTAGTYNFPEQRTPFDERNPEAVKSAQREALRRQIEREEAERLGKRAESRRDSSLTDRREGNE